MWLGPHVGAGGLFCWHTSLSLDIHVLPRDQNRSHYRARWRFFPGTLIIFASVFALRALDVSGVVQSVIFTWNIYHVSAERRNPFHLSETERRQQKEKLWAT